MFFSGSKPSPLASAIDQNIWSYDGFLTHQLVNIENKQIKNKAFDESEKRKSK